MLCMWLAYFQITSDNFRIAVGTIALSSFSTSSCALTEIIKKPGATEPSNKSSLTLASCKPLPVTYTNTQSRGIVCFEYGFCCVHEVEPLQLFANVAMHEQPHHTSTPTFDPGPVQAQGLWDDLVNVLATPLLATTPAQMMVTLQLVLLFFFVNQVCYMKTDRIQPKIAEIANIANRLLLFQNKKGLIKRSYSTILEFANWHLWRHTL